VANLSLTGVLLVGGTSRRFGSPKALAEIKGETLAERAWRTLGAVCDDRVAVGKSVDGLGFPFPVHDDGTPVRAPLAGVVAGLRRASHDVCVVLPVDCPLVSPEALARLADACADAAVSQTGPLPGAFRRTALPHLQQRLIDGKLALGEALDELETRVVELDPDELVTVNTEGDLRRLVAGS
jgi:molybdopterin-guanine dinucleotide biosynthesis protein A